MNRLKGKYALMIETRNRALADSDWTQATDSPLDDATKAEWVIYRQKLRDLPDKAGFPDVLLPCPPDASQRTKEYFASLEAD